MTHSADFASTSAPTVGLVARVWIVTLGAGLAAALISWAAGESMMIDESGRGAKGKRIPISPVIYITRNGVTSFGLLGGSLGLGLGLAGGLLRGSARSAGLAGLVGIVLGGAAGAGAAKGLVPRYFSTNAEANPSVPLLVHGGLWMSISIAAGLGFGLGIGGRGRVIEAVIYAIAGALLAILTYEFASVWLFPAAQTERPLSRSPGSRLFADLLVSCMIGAALAFGASRRRSAKGTTTPTTS